MISGQVPPFFEDGFNPSDENLIDAAKSALAGAANGVINFLKTTEIGKEIAARQRQEAINQLLQDPIVLGVLAFVIFLVGRGSSR